METYSHSTDVISRLSVAFFQTFDALSFILVEFDSTPALSTSFGTSRQSFPPHCDNQDTFGSSGSTRCFRARNGTIRHLETRFSPFSSNNSFHELVERSFAQIKGFYYGWEETCLDWDEESKEWETDG